MKDLTLLLIFIFLFTTAGCSQKNVAVKQITAPATTATQTEAESDAATSDGWKAKSGEYWVSLTKDDISAKNAVNDAEVFSIRKAASSRARAAYPDRFADGKPTFEDLTLDYEIASIVGKYLFLKETAVSSPQTFTYQKYMAIDLSQPTANVTLTDLFADKDIFDALKANLKVEADLKAKAETGVQDLDALFAIYKNESNQYTFDDGCKLDAAGLASFIVKPLDDEKVSVVLGLACQAGMRDEEIKPLELLLPISKMKAPLSSADIAQARANLASMPANAKAIKIGLNAEAFNPKTKSASK